MLARLSHSLLFAALMQQASLPAAPAPSASAMEKSAVASQAANSPRPQPVLVFQVAPEFSERARKKHVSGNVEISLIVDRNGIPQSVVVVHGVGMGLDEKAVEAVRQYRFQPALAPDGTPLAVKTSVSVNFQIF